MITLVVMQTKYNLEQALETGIDLSKVGCYRGYFAWLSEQNPGRLNHTPSIGEEVKSAAACGVLSKVSLVHSPGSVSELVLVFARGIRHR